MMETAARRSWININGHDITFDVLRFLKKLKWLGKTWPSDKQHGFRKGSAYRHMKRLLEIGALRVNLTPDGRKECEVSEEWKEILDNYNFSTDDGLPPEWNGTLKERGGVLTNKGGGNIELIKYRNSYPVEASPLASGYSYIIASEQLQGVLLSASVIQGCPVLHLSAGYNKFVGIHSGPDYQ